VSCTKHDLAFEYNPERHSFSADEKTLVENLWKKTLKRHPSAFDGPLYDVLEIQLNRKSLHMKVQDTSYKEVSATRNVEFHRRFGRESCVNPLGVGTVVVTTDGFVPVGRRKATEIDRHKLEIVAVYVDRDRDARANRPDPFRALLREINEEISVRKESVIDAKCIGVISEHQTYMAFEAEIDLSSRELRELLKGGTPEFTDFHFLNISPDRLCGFLVKSAPQIQGHSLANLLLSGRRRHGKEFCRTLKL
jgi:hypothetical protein